MPPGTLVVLVILIVVYDLLQIGLARGLQWDTYSLHQESSLASCLTMTAVWRNGYFCSFKMQMMWEGCVLQCVCDPLHQPSIRHLLLNSLTQA